MIMEFIKNERKIKLIADEEEVGYITFYKSDGKLVVDHTYVNPLHRGKNYARVLVDEVVKDARKQGVLIVPLCPYVDKVLNNSPSFSDVLYKERAWKMLFF